MLRQVLGLHGGVVDVVHAHAVPHLDAPLVTRLVAHLHEVGHVLEEHLRVPHQPRVAVVGRFAAQEQMAFRIKGAVLPDRCEDLAVEERPLEVQVIEDRLHAAVRRVEVDVLAEAVNGHHIRWSPEVPCVRIYERCLPCYPLLSYTGCKLRLLSVPRAQARCLRSLKVIPPGLCLRIGLVLKIAVASTDDEPCDGPVHDEP